MHRAALTLPLPVRPGRRGRRCGSGAARERAGLSLRDPGPARILSPPCTCGLLSPSRGFSRHGHSTPGLWGERVAASQGARGGQAVWCTPSDGGLVSSSCNSKMGLKSRMEF